MRGGPGKVTQVWDIVGMSICCHCLKLVKIERKRTAEESRVGT